MKQMMKGICPRGNNKMAIILFHFFFRTMQENCMYYIKKGEKCPKKGKEYKTEYSLVKLDLTKKKEKGKHTQQP
jgi:hypothetical protein